MRDWKAHKPSCLPSVTSDSPDITPLMIAALDGQCGVVRWEMVILFLSEINHKLQQESSRVRGQRQLPEQ